MPVLSYWDISKSESKSPPFKSQIPMGGNTIEDIITLSDIKDYDNTAGEVGKNLRDILTMS